MSLINKFAKNKNVFKKYKKFTHANIKPIVDEATPTRHLELNIDGVFKMITIKYNGRITLHQTNLPGLYIKVYKNNIKIINFSRKELSGKKLLEYNGSIHIKKCKVYGIGQQSISATIENENTEELQDSDEVMSDSGAKMGNKSRKIRNTKYEKNIEILSSGKQDLGIIMGLYTKGNRFRLNNNKRYKGYYHYHTKRKIYMTGYNHEGRSLILRRIPKYISKKTNKELDINKFKKN